MPNVPAEGENGFALRAGEIHIRAVWLTADETSIRGCRAALSLEELERAGRFASDRLRRGYQIAHAALRLLLASYLGFRPEEICFRYGRRGKPELQAASDIRFNLAHSGALALYAFARQCEVGVDVEELRAVPDMELIAGSYFCTAEAVELLSLQTAKDRTQAFFRCWTRKEAYIKAVGEGLFLPLDRFQVTISSAAPVKLIHIGRDRAQAEAWQLRDIAPAPNYTGALAYRGESRKVCVFPPIGVSQLLGSLRLRSLRSLRT